MTIRNCVAPLVGAWIEILTIEMNLTIEEYVAPLVGAWIEIYNFIIAVSAILSLPSWERGLKYGRRERRTGDCRVAPLVGAWIEMS